MQFVREKNRERAARAGYAVPEALPPLIDESEVGIKSVAQVIDRSLALFCVLAVIFEPPKSFREAQTQVWKWLAAQGLDTALTPDEGEAFQLNASQTQLHKKFWGQQESLYALGWALGVVAEISPMDYLPEDFGALFPDTEAGDVRSTFASRCSLRPEQDLIQETDFWYCLHWVATEELLQKAVWQRSISPSAIVARRKALEWVITSQHWDEVALDT